MDPERLPLLAVNSELRCRRHRPLSHEEVQAAQTELSWRRTRFFLLLMFWAIMAMFLSIITCLLITSPQCHLMPAVPPVHMSFTPLVSRAWASTNDGAYAL